MNNARLTSRKLFGVIAALVFIIAIIKIWNIPRVSILKTMKSSKISGPVYRGEAGVFDQFYLDYEFENPGRVPVEITKLESTILINGTNYNSQQITHGLAIIRPDSKAELVRVVQLSNAPIGNVEGQHWNITFVSEIEGESGFLILDGTETFTDIRSIDWEVHLFE